MVWKNFAELETKLNKILHLGCLISKSEGAYLIGVTGSSYKTYAVSGKVDADAEIFSEFNREFIDRTFKNDIPLEELPSYGTFRDESGIASVYYKHLHTFNNIQCIVFFLLSNGNEFSFDLSEEFTAYLDTLKETIELFFNAESERLFNVDLPVIITNGKGELININSKAERLFNIKNTASFETFKNSLSLYYKNDVRIPFDELPFITAVKKKEKILFVKAKYKKAGEKKEEWFRINSIPYTNEAGEIDTVLTTLWDVTGKFDYEDWFEETAKNIQSVLYSSDVVGRQLNFVSEAAANIFGFDKKDLKNDFVFLLRRIHPQYLKTFRSFLKKVNSGEDANIEYKLVCADSREFYVRHMGFPIMENGKVVRVVGSITNITDEVNFRKQLVKSEERFRLLIETADDFIFTLNSYGYFVTVNTLGAKGFGYTPEEMIDRHFLEFVDDESKADVAIAFQKILTNEDLTRFNVRFIDKFGSSLVYEINARNIQTENGTGGLIGIGREISERIKNEEKLKELNAKLIEANRLISIEQDRAKQQISVLEELNRLKNEFISSVSHELRTPLASIVGFAETLTYENDLTPELSKEFSEIIYNEGRRLARLINDILDFSKLESNREALEKNTINIVDLLNETAEKWQHPMKKKELSFHVEIPAETIELYADKERISKAVGNLLSNAIKFTNKGGRVSLLLRDFPKEIEIIVSDTGAGIPKEELPRLFQKFSKVNRSGTQIPGAGFGLAAVKQIVDLHNGLIKVKSEIDKGSTFIMKLPKK